MKLPEQDFDLNEENVGVFLPGRKLESMTFTSPMTTCKIALCTPKAKYNKPWDELRCLYESFLLKDSARWYHAVYFRMLSSEFMGEFVGSDSRLVNLQRTFEDQGRAVFDRRFVYGKSDHPLGYVPAEVEHSLSQIRTKSELIKHLKLVPHVGRFYAQHAQIILFKGGSSQVMQRMDIEDDGAICVGDGGTRVLLMTMARIGSLTLVMVKLHFAL